MMKMIARRSTAQAPLHKLLHLLFLGSAIFLAAVVHAEPKRGSKEQSNSERAAVEAACKATKRAARKLKQVHVPVEGQSTEGGQLTAFVDAGTVLQIQVELLGELGRQDSTWTYAREGALLCAISRVSTYAHHIMEGEGPLRVAKTETTRAVFRQGRALLLIGGEGRRVPVASPSGQKEAKSWLVQGADYLKRARAALKP